MSKIWKFREKFSSKFSLGEFLILQFSFGESKVLQKREFHRRQKWAENLMQSIVDLIVGFNSIQNWNRVMCREFPVFKKHFVRVSNRPVRMNSIRLWTEFSLIS